jgi:hypothetical protein
VLLSGKLGIRGWPCVRGTIAGIACGLGFHCVSGSVEDTANGRAVTVDPTVQSEPTSSERATADSDNRPWLILCSVDDRPNRVVMGFARGILVSYDLSTCGLYRVWKGSLGYPDGDVIKHDTLRIRTVGDVLLPGVAETCWYVERDGRVLPVVAVCRGFEFDKRGTSLRFALTIDGTAVEVEETPEILVNQRLLDAIESCSGERLSFDEGELRRVAGLRRAWRCSDVPVGIRIGVVVNRPVKSVMFYSSEAAVRSVSEAEGRDRSSERTMVLFGNCQRAVIIHGLEF